MEFESPDVMKDFPGLYASEYGKRCNNDTDYSDDNDKMIKKESSSKKKDKKDKEKGYAALEGESSDESSTKSPSKSKRSKPFIFTAKTREKRDKSREKDAIDKKKDKDKKLDKKIEKDKVKIEKNTKKCKQQNSEESSIDIAEILPVFGVSLDECVENNRCHDGIKIPLPVRQCLDYIGSIGLSFENVYKISGNKSKVLHLKKLYNQHEFINLYDYDVPTATSLLKTFLRDLPEPIFTNDSLIRFEEAGAILTTTTREKHLKTLIENLPNLNRLLLSWLIMHLDIVSMNEKINKMSKQHLANALNHTFHCSSRLLYTLLQHCGVLFQNMNIQIYLPPLKSWTHLPNDRNDIELELSKQESLLNQIHKEISVGCISKKREELLWDVQRIITQLKRKLKTTSKEITSTLQQSHPIGNSSFENNFVDTTTDDDFTFLPHTVKPHVNIDELDYPQQQKQQQQIDRDILFVQLKHDALEKFRDDLQLQIYKIRTENAQIQTQLLALDDTYENSTIPQRNCALNNTNNTTQTTNSQIDSDNGNNMDLDHVMDLLMKENQILHIKKMNLVRQIVEEKEKSIELTARLISNNTDTVTTLTNT